MEPDEPTPLHPVRRLIKIGGEPIIETRCRHGHSQYYVKVGSDGRPSRAELDRWEAWHRRYHRCDCGPYPDPIF